MKTISEAEYNELKQLAEENESLKKKNKWLLEEAYKNPRQVERRSSDVEMQSASIPAAVVEEMSSAEFTEHLVARRSISAMDLVRRDSGITAPHRYSLTDLIGYGGANPRQLERKPSAINLAREDTRISIAIQRSLSSQVMPSVFLKPIVRPGKEDIKSEMEAQPEEMKYIEHQFDLARLAEYFRTNINVRNVRSSGGLSADQAAYVLQTHGPNMLTPPPRIPLWMLFLLQFTNIFMILLMSAGVLSIIAWAIAPSDFTSLYLGILLFVIVLFTCYETYSQEAKSDQLMETFRAMIPESANVIRDGIIAPLKVENLVCGDIIRLKSGDKVPADCRVILTESMKIDQSMITGESEPVDSTVNAADPDPLEAKNIIFNGSLVVDGGCLAVVVRTGDDTLIGTMVGLTEDAGKASSTLKCDVEHFVLLLTKFALVQAIIVFIVGCIRGINPLEAFIQGFISK
jgi:magnesium-transporting ATPase (P-type)